MVDVVDSTWLTHETVIGFYFSFSAFDIFQTVCGKLLLFVSSKENRASAQKIKERWQDGTVHGSGLFAADSTVAATWKRGSGASAIQRQTGIGKNKKLVVVISRRHRGFGIGYIDESYICKHFI